MGRSLFSQNYSTPQSVSDLDSRSHDTWSKSNPFDPDSDDFFIDAVYEAFLHPSEFRVSQQEPRLVLRDDDEGNLVVMPSIIMQLDNDRDSGVSLSSGSPVLSSRDSPSPMAVGADDPAIILADAGYTDATLSSEWLRTRASMAATYESWMRVGRPVSALPTDVASPPVTGYIPPLSIDEPDHDTALRLDQSLPLQAQTRHLNRGQSPPISSAQDRLPTLSSGQPPNRSNPIPISPRTVSITPIDLPSPPPRSPSSIPSLLQTPSRSRDTSQIPDMSTITPSPAPSVTPRIYTWHSTASPWMTQSPTPRPPTVSQPTPASPLTNPGARISHSRLTLAPVHLRMQSAAI